MHAASKQCHLPRGIKKNPPWQTMKLVARLDVDGALGNMGYLSLHNQGIGHMPFEGKNTQIILGTLIRFLCPRFQLDVSGGDVFSLTMDDLI